MCTQIRSLITPRVLGLLFSFFSICSSTIYENAENTDTMSKMVSNIFLLMILWTMVFL